MKRSSLAPLLQPRRGRKHQPMDIVTTRGVPGQDRDSEKRPIVAAIRQHK